MTEEKKEEVKDPVPTELAMIDRATEAAAVLKERTEALKAENDRTEKLQTRAALGGQTDATALPKEPEKTDEEKAKEAKIKELGESTGSEWAKDKKE